MNTCRWCGESGSVRTGRKYCSQACYGMSQRSPIRACIGCGAPYSPHFRDQTYCSRSCAADARSKKITTACAHCGCEFTAPPSAKQRFCSRRCKGSASRRELTRICETCEEEFTRTRTHSRGRLESSTHFAQRRTCSTACGTLSARRSQRLPPNERHQWVTPEQRAAHATTRHQKQSTSLTHATRHGFMWTGPELETALRADLTAGEIAEMLGRSIAAVGGARWRARHEPKWRLVVGL